MDKLSVPLGQVGPSINGFPSVYTCYSQQVWRILLDVLPLW